jgi:hypothetical protein
MTASGYTSEFVIPAVGVVEVEGVEVELSVADDEVVLTVAAVEFTVATYEFTVAADEFTVAKDEFTFAAIELTIAVVESEFLEVKLLAVEVTGEVFLSKEALLIAEVELAVISMMDAPESGGFVGETEFKKSCDPVESFNCPKVESCAAELPVIEIASGESASREVSGSVAVWSAFPPAVGSVIASDSPPPSFTTSFTVVESCQPATLIGFILTAAFMLALI